MALRNWLLKNKYLKMQNKYYDEQASLWNLTNKDPVVGTYEMHDKWTDYDNFLFRNIQTKDKVALEYGCGPGRNLIKFSDLFLRIDGVDISKINLQKAVLNLESNNVLIPNLYQTSGDNLNMIADLTYDLIFSVICFQHICVYEIRDKILKECFRVLKGGGKLCFQMGFGGKENFVTAKYHENAYDALSTNGYYDVSIQDENDLRTHLQDIGFHNYVSHIRETGPGDNHRNWIWVQVEK